MCVCLLARLGEAAARAAGLAAPAGMYISLLISLSLARSLSLACSLSLSLYVCVRVYVRASEKLLRELPASPRQQVSIYQLHLCVSLYVYMCM